MWRCYILRPCYSHFCWCVYVLAIIRAVFGPYLVSCKKCCHGHSSGSHFVLRGVSGDHILTKWGQVNSCRMYLCMYNMDRDTVGSCKAVHVNGVKVHDDGRWMLPRDLLSSLILHRFTCSTSMDSWKRTWMDISGDDFYPMNTTMISV